MNRTFGKFWLGVGILLLLVWGRGILAGTGPEASPVVEPSAAIEPDLAILMPTVTPTPEPTAVPTRTPRPAATPTPDTWYRGGTLYDATLAQWRAAGDENKLATAAGWAIVVYKPTPNDETELGAIAILLSMCVDEVADDPELLNLGSMKANEIAAACITLMQK